jgi:predicted small secreted protein
MKKILVALIISSAFLVACDRNEMDYAGKKAPKGTPSYTVTADDSRNK